MTPVRRFFATFALLSASASPLVAATSIPTNATANLVLGQADFTTNISPSPATATGLNIPTAVAVDTASGKVFVADRDNNRVLRYPSQTALTNGAAPDLVLGQVNFSESAVNQGLGAPSQTSLAGPSGLFVDSAGRLWVADTGNNRVLMFANAANLSAVPAFADRVYGQPDFVTNTAAPTQSKLASPTGLCVDPNGVLWIADTGSHRVLGFKNAATLGNGPNADRVLGQTTFTGNTAGTTQRQFFNPTGVSASATQLWVADRDNNRVLRFPNFPTQNDAPAGLVLGQTNYTSSTAGTSATAFTGPSSVFLSGTNVWVADSSNNRVLGFAITSATTFGAAASVAVGQPSLVTGGSGLSAQNLTLDARAQITVDAEGSLWVADQLNNRVLRFGATNVIPDEPPTIAFNSPTKIVTTKSNIVVKGTAGSAAGIARVSFKIGAKGYYRASGTTSWKATIPVKKGKTRLEFIAVDVNGVLSAPGIVNVQLVTKPTVTVKGSLQVSTTDSTITLTGTAAAPGGVDRVGCSVEGGDSFFATGKSNWKVTVGLKVGTSTIEFRAIDKTGKESKPVVVKVTRSEP
jgi:sugar lactone lactonase YvrE